MIVLFVLLLFIRWLVGRAVIGVSGAELLTPSALLLPIAYRLQSTLSNK